MKRKKSNNQYAVALFHAVEGLRGEKLGKALQAFAELLVRDHKLKRANKIIEEFVKYGKKQSGIVEIEIISAKELDSHTLAHIKSSFGKKEKVESVEKIDKSLLGGVKVKLEDKIVDASLKTQLNKLKQSLII